IPDAGTTTPAGTIIFRLSSGNNVVTEAGVAPGNAITAARIYVDYTGTQTGIALVNPADTPADVILTILDRFGFPISSVPQVLPPRSHLARFVREIFPVTDGFTGLLEMRSSLPIVSVALKLTINRRGDLVLTTLPVADLTRPVVSGL